MWSEKQKLQEEKLALGYYFSGHLFSAHEKEVRKFIRLRLADVQPSRDLQTLAGTIAALRTQMTRRGKMIILTLDDGTAQCEVSVFNEVFENSRQLIREDELVFVQAKISNDEYSGGLRVTADSIADLAHIRGQHAKRLRIRLNGNANPARLKQALEPYSARRFGEQAAVPVVLEYCNHEGVRSEIRLGDGWRIRPQDELLAELRNTVGKDSAEVEYA
jgi:DNA polymerase III subunit alpha